MALSFESISNFFLGSALDKLSSNFEKVADEFDKVVYRDGSNVMSDSLDMNGNRILNISPGISANDVATVAQLSTIPRGDKGDPGGNVMSIGPLAQAPTINVEVGTDVVRTSGYALSGDGGSARYQYDASVDAAYVTANPRSSFLSLNGRGFRVSADQGLTPRQFGAKGDGATDDTVAFNTATAIAQLLKSTLIIPGGDYRVKNWAVLRAGGSLRITLDAKARILFHASKNTTDVLLLVQADDVTVEGGTFDGGEASGFITPGDNILIHGYAGAPGDNQIRRFNIRNTIACNGNSNLIRVLSGVDCVAENVTAYNSGLNLICFAAGNTVSGTSFDGEQKRNRILRCAGDRTMNGVNAQQGCFKIIENGAHGTAKNSDECLIVGCVASMAEPTTEVNGNVVIEIYGRGSGSQISECITNGGYIGVSIAFQTKADINNCRARRAKGICLELAGCSLSNIRGSDADCDNFSAAGWALDFQGADVEPAYGLTVDANVNAPTVRGGYAIAGNPTTPNVYRGQTAQINSRITFGTTPGVVGVYVAAIKNVTVNLQLDGNNVANGRGISFERSTEAQLSVSGRQLAGNWIALTLGGTESMNNVHMTVQSLDSTGIFPITEIPGGASGSFGSNFTLASTGLGFGTASDVRLSRFAYNGSTYGASVIDSGLVAGTPEGNVYAAVGSRLTRTDGGAGTTTYVKESGTGTQNGWVGK